ncbi:hypothetical protein [Muribaculum intestinale]|uniref:Uncharacterized protein n=1 Tax=Muribaculum intestinale TaxID=1796646 RepID=A0A4S2FXX9_9BACT|nr:hypothetical protein [Muribaculum intestinale]MYM12409.1 hypothetical protein [Muribaculum intestinale]RXE74656.1 hypothetical protein ED551_02150 [Muribaculaceae bacterium Isolate-013 (NCI)]TGY74198.1 hypothetical protein E5333_07165 [Muribaculum intestinale]
MEITPKIRFVSGRFDTKDVRLVCVPSDNHGEVSLCVNEPGCGWNIPIGEIKLYSSGRYVDFKATLEDATKFGEEICRRFNEFPQDKKL